LLRWDGKLFEPWAGLRCTAGVAIPIVGATALGHSAWGVLASLGALYTGLASFSGVYLARLRIMLVTSIVISLVTMLGCVVSPSPIGAWIAVFLVALLATFLSGIGPAANSLAVKTAGIMVVVAGIPSTAANPIGNGMLVFAGGIIQTLLLTFVWPVFPNRPEREAVASVFDGFAEYVDSACMAGIQGEIPDAVALQNAWDLITQTETVAARREHVRLRHALVQAETIRAGLVGFAATHREICASDPVRQADAMRLARRLRTVFQRTAKTLRDKSARPLKPLTHSAHELEGGTRYEELQRWFELLREVNHIASEAPEPVETDGPARSWSRDVLGRLKEQITDDPLRSLSARTSLRYALTLGVAEAASHLWNSGHTYWLPLTVCLILRSDYGTTLSKGLARVLGTIGGVALASLLAYVLHPSPAAVVMMMLFGGWMACALFAANYTYYSVGITLYVVFSLVASGIAERTAGIDRMAATTMGFLIAILVNVVWPIWQSGQVREMLLDAVRAQLAYSEALLKMIRGEAPGVSEITRNHARTLRLEAERIVTAARQEPKRGRENLPRESDEILTVLNENAALLLVSHAEAVHARIHLSPVPQAAQRRGELAVSQGRAAEQRLKAS